MKSTFAFLGGVFPEGNLPRADVLLAQKPALELFELDVQTVAQQVPQPLPLPQTVKLKQIMTSWRCVAPSNWKRNHL